MTEVETEIETVNEIVSEIVSETVTVSEAVSESASVIVIVGGLALRPLLSDTGAAAAAAAGL